MTERLAFDTLCDLILRSGLRARDGFGEALDPIVDLARQLDSFIHGLEILLSSLLDVVEVDVGNVAEILGRELDGPGRVPGAYLEHIPRQEALDTWRC